MSEDAKNTTINIIPTLRYIDAPAAVDWLCKAFGFNKKLIVPDVGGGIAHAQLTFGNGMVMLGSAREDEFGKLQSPLSSPDLPVSQSPYVIVNDVDLHCARARSVGAEVVIEPEDQAHGGRLYSCRDMEGNLWNFGTYDPWNDV